MLETFEQSLGERASSAAQELPSMESGRALLSWFEKFQEWLLSWFKIPALPINEHLPPDILFAIFKYLIMGVAAGTVLLLLWALYRGLKQSPLLGRSQQLKKGGGEAQTMGRSLTEEISAALEAGDYAQAARLRWKFFLQKQDAPPTLSPLSFDSEHGFGQAAPADLASWLPSVLRLMFGRESDPRSQFLDLETRLSRMEKQKDA